MHIFPADRVHGGAARERERVRTTGGQVNEVLPRQAQASPADAADALAALSGGVLGIDARWRIVFATDGWLRALGARASEYVGRDLWSSVPALAAEADRSCLRNTRADGIVRTFRLPCGDARPGAVLDVTVTRSPKGLLVLEGREVSHAGLEALESESLRDLARAMSMMSDTAALLEHLAAAAMQQCGADSALVAQVRGDEGEFVAAAGRAAPLRGARFLLPGSLIDDVVRRRTALTVTAGLADGLRGVADHLAEGPAILAPLVAYDRVLGVLAIARGPEGRPFDAAAGQRLTAIAEHASLALWKSRLFEEAQAASQAKSNFLASISHELRTPLTALTGYGELLADEILGPMTEGQHEMIERMRSVTHHLSGMIDEILTYSSIEASREIVRPCEVLAADLVQSACAVVEPIARQKGVTVDCVLPDRTTRVTTDVDKVRQILVNLAGNAVKFTDVGSVTLALESADGLVRFAVRDTGIGITEEDQARLFQPFTQLDAGLTRRHGGTGLGLYIAQRLAMLIGGRVELESVPGNGSTFTLVLPLVCEARQPG